MNHLSNSRRSLIVLSITIIVGISLSLLASIYVGRCKLNPKQTQLNVSFAENSQGVYASWQALGVLGTGLGLTTLLGIYLRLQQRERERLETALKQQNLHKQEQEKQLAENTALIEQLQVTAELYTKAKNTFFARMSDKLRNPLHTILGYTQLIQSDSSLNNKTRSYLDLLQFSGENLLNLINELLEIAKVESGQLTVTRVSFNLLHLLESIKAQLEPKAVSKGLQLIFYVPDDVPSSCKADESKLRLVLLHLLDNGIKFTQSGGVTLRLGIGSSFWMIEAEQSSSSSPESDFIFFEIEDTGCGMDGKQVERIFEPLDLTNLENQAGFGLALSSKIIKLMGGKITINSKLKQGTIVKIKLPVIMDSVEDWQAAFQLPGRVIGLAPEQPEYTILIADDKVENRHLLVDLLKPLGFHVLEAENGEETVRLWTTCHPHLIWMDTRMPIMDGYQAIKHIRQLEQKDESNPKTIIIALCSGILEEEQADSLAYGCDDVIHKPIEVEILLQKMAQYLGICYLYDREDLESPINNDNLSNLALSHIHRSQKTQPFTKNGYYLPHIDPELTPDSLQVMSDNWRMLVYQAASAGDSIELYQLIQQIPKNHYLLASELNFLVDQFNFRKLRELTQVI